MKRTPLATLLSGVLDEFHECDEDTPGYVAARARIEQLFAQAQAQRVKPLPPLKRVHD